MGANVLMIDDNPADAELVRLAVGREQLGIELHHELDGAGGLAYLEEPTTTNPDLVLLDLNMPRMSGHEVLTAMKADPALRHIPVVVVTSSADPPEIRQVYSSHAAALLVKPQGIGELQTILRKLEEFWFEAAHLPSEL